MSVKYSKLPSEESDSTVIDFGSPFNYKSKEYPKYFSYSNNDKIYKSVFTYSGYRPEGYGDFGTYFVCTCKKYADLKQYKTLIHEVEKFYPIGLLNLTRSSVSENKSFCIL